MRELHDKARSTRTDSEAQDYATKKFQKEIRARIRLQEAYDPHSRIRRKLERWRFEGLPRRVATTFEAALGRLRKLVPPRVVAAVLSTGWNRW